ncbi:MAG: methylmalonyl Co-A mutase-associated GTPase MeaB [Bacteroidetes bacterium]|nr:MAG: methylmalonyl Co-A mutase-associated GTPase MeaB [Bacteroidota bacterium]
MARKRKSVQEYASGVLAGDRVMLAQAITLVESTLESDSLLAEELLHAVQSHGKQSFRLGISGVPGVGKSTFIDAFGTYVCDELHKKVAVLAVDPSSSLSRGSILGDKTRMSRLSVNANAFIRPSASGGTLGGVAARTREAILLCEAAGYEYIVVETVGVGQSETLVKGMVDFFLLLMLSGAGDELQGIKRGIMEICDALVINKADGDNKPAAKRAAAEYRNALHLLQASDSGWIPRVATCSALAGEGIADLYTILDEFERAMRLNGFLDKNRAQQQVDWFNDLLRSEVLRQFYQNEDVKTDLSTYSSQIALGELSLRAGLRQLRNKYFAKP